ncbi:hypothetical protein Pmani_030974 [Petrolisthes manimaculis]|uniref:Uncharacterized protein n=1 Tax=Petrolisthes manimaculis TaxID=1843537 RepID=A0AAE1NW30_9EUCA|nr:hypothetical protein Pmani_030974 [Petrolisthes manimaculis]
MVTLRNGERRGMSQGGERKVGYMEGGGRVVVVRVGGEGREEEEKEETRGMDGRRLSEVGNEDEGKEKKCYWGREVVEDGRQGGRRSMRRKQETENGKTSA